MANTERQSAFVAYCINFRNHLRRQQEDLEDFLEFYEYWAPIRQRTITALENLQDDADEQHCSHRKATVGTKIAAVAGNATFIAGCVFLNPAVAAAGKMVATTASGAAAGVSAAAYSQMSSIKREAMELMEFDVIERQALITLGLQYNEIVEKIEEAILNLKGMPFSELSAGISRGLADITDLKNFSDELQRHNWSRGNIPRDVINLIVRFFQDNRRIEGAAEITRVCKKFINCHAEAFEAGENCLKICFDIYCLKQLFEEQKAVLNIFGSGALCHAINGVIMFKDCYDIARIWVEGVKTKSVTGEEIRKVLTYLKKEYELITKNYERLKRFSERN